MLENVSTLDGLPDDLIESKHAARIAKCHIRAVYRWVLKGKIRGWRRCGRMFVSRSELVGLFEPMVPTKDQPRLNVPTKRQVTAGQKWAERVLIEKGVKKPIHVGG